MAKPDGKQIAGRGKTQRKIKALKKQTDAIKRSNTSSRVESTSFLLGPLTPKVKGRRGPQEKQTNAQLTQKQHPKVSKDHKAGKWTDWGHD